MTADPDRPGPNDLVTPFVWVPHGAPDPVEWKRAHPGWVSFPATFVPHKRPIPQWTVRNGRRWPMSKKGQPWPSSRFGQPMCPLDEFPPGMPAPGTQGRLLAEQADAVRRGVEDVTSGKVSVAEVMAEVARQRAELAAKRAASPAPSSNDVTGPDPWAPVRAYQDHIAHEPETIRALATDFDGLAPSTCRIEVAMACDQDGVLVVTPKR